MKNSHEMPRRWHDQQAEPKTWVCLLYQTYSGNYLALGGRPTSGITWSNVCMCVCALRKKIDQQMPVIILSHH